MADNCDAFLVGAKDSRGLPGVSYLSARIGYGTALHPCLEFAVQAGVYGKSGLAIHHHQHQTHMFWYMFQGNGVQTVPTGRRISEMFRLGLYS
jgi:hypothetical protein